jgi:SAM-dependent methyltransferase
VHKYFYTDHNWLVLKGNNEVVRRHMDIMCGVVYDLGCGIRPYEHDILSKADQYVGVDWSGTLHGLCSDVVADLNRTLPIENDVADTVVSFQVLEHLSEPQTMLNEACRILKPGGQMLLTVPWQWTVHEVPYDYFRYTPFGLKYLFEKAGFVDVVVKPQSGFFTMWILKMNYFSLRFVCGPKPLRWLIKLGLVPCWFVGQILAPLLDKLDLSWGAETSGYYVTARKPVP